MTNITTHHCFSQFAFEFTLTVHDVKSNFNSGLYYNSCICFHIKESGDAHRRAILLEIYAMKSVIACAGAKLSTPVLVYLLPALILWDHHFAAHSN